MNQYRRRRLDILGVPDAFCLQLLLTGPVGIVHHERGRKVPWQWAIVRWIGFNSSLIVNQLSPPGLK